MFFSSPRWTILDIIAKRPSSPLEISQEMGTSVSYVSQQLRLLEAANLVIKERTGNAEKGKPRMVFSVPREMMHMTVLINQLPAKKLLYLTSYHKLILRIWLLENPTLHPLIEKLYWQLESSLDIVDGIFVQTSGSTPKVYVVSAAAKITAKVASYQKEVGAQLDAHVITMTKAKRFVNQEVHPIYDPHFIFAPKEEEA